MTFLLERCSPETLREVEPSLRIDLSPSSQGKSVTPGPRGDEPPRVVCPDHNVTLVACYWRRAGYHSRSTVPTLANAGSRHPSSDVPAAISPKIRAERLRRVSSQASEHGGLRIVRLGRPGVPELLGG